MKIPELLQEHNIRYMTEGHHHCRPGWLQIDCPFCGRGSESYHMGYPLDGRIFCCWKCGSHSLFDTLIALLNISPKQCIRILADIETTCPLIEQKKTGRYVEPRGLEEMLPAHRKYLKKRGYDPDHIAQFWGVKGIGLAGRLKWRLWIPITFNRERVSWTTRSIGETGTRYLSANENEESIPHKDLLYGEDICGHSLLICEGPLDVWRLGPSAVCTFGIAFSEAQVLRMTKYPVRVVIYDAQPQAQRQAHKLLDLLSVFPGENYNVVLDSKDPGEATERELEKIRRRFL